MELLIVTAALVTLAIYWRLLPLQNIVAIFFITFGLSSAIEMFSAKVGLPISQSLSSAFTAIRQLTVVPFPVSFAWLIFLLLTRLIAKWIWKFRRSSGTYGSEILLITASATATLYTASLSLAGKQSSWQNWLGVFISAILILLCLTPWLLQKKPAAEA